jgi:hypothetical protein
LSEPPAEDSSSLVDLTGMTLERIRQICDSSADLDPDGLANRPVLRWALLRVQREAAEGEQSFAGHNNHIF